MKFILWTLVWFTVMEMELWLGIARDGVRATIKARHELYDENTRFLASWFVILGWLGFYSLMVK
jgi:hypothetical protein